MWRTSISLVCYARSPLAFDWAIDPLTAARDLHDTQQDDDGISDAETEVQANYPSIRDQQDGNALRGAEQPEQVRLRTRTILLELANELEKSRQEIGSLQAEKDKAVSLRLARSRPCLR